MMSRRNRCRTVLERRERASRGLLIIVCLAIGGILLVSLFFNERGLARYLDMRKRADSLENEIKELTKTNSDLRSEIGRLQSNAASIEALARDRLGFVRKGETVYQIVEEGSGSADSK